MTGRADTRIRGYAVLNEGRADTRIRGYAVLRSFAILLYRAPAYPRNRERQSYAVTRTRGCGMLRSFRLSSPLRVRETAKPRDHGHE